MQNSQEKMWNSAELFTLSRERCQVHWSRSVCGLQVTVRTSCYIWTWMFSWCWIRAPISSWMICGATFWTHQYMMVLKRKLGKHQTEVHHLKEPNAPEFGLTMCLQQWWYLRLAHGGLQSSKDMTHCQTSHAEGCNRQQNLFPQYLQTLLHLSHVLSEEHVLLVSPANQGGCRYDLMLPLVVKSLGKKNKTLNYPRISQKGWKIGTCVSE